MLQKLSILVILSLSVLLIFGFQKKDDLEADKEAIKKLLAYETKVAYAQNLEEIEKTWVHEPYAFWTFVSKNVQWEYVGWDAIDNFFKSYIEKNLPYEDEAVQENFTFRFYGKGAWVTYEQYNKKQREKNPQHIPARKIQVLEKTDEGWKLAFLASIGRNAYHDKEVEQDLNNVGYKLLGQEKVKEAIEVFKTNVILYPKSSNVYDGLGEAYMKNGDKALAIENYNKSLDMDPKNDNAKEMLKKMKE